MIGTETIAKNLLEGKTCNTCRQYKGDYDEDEKIIPKMCICYLGTGTGWKWRHLPEENTCENWKKTPEDCVGRNKGIPYIAVCKNYEVKT